MGGTVTDGSLWARIRGAASGTRMHSAVITGLANTAASAGFALILARLTGPATVGTWALLLLASALLAYALSFGLGAGLRVRGEGAPTTDWLGSFWRITKWLAVLAALTGSALAYTLVINRLDENIWVLALAGGGLCAALSLQAAALWVGIATGRLAEVSLVAAAGTIGAALGIGAYQLLTGSLPLWFITMAYAAGALPPAAYGRRLVHRLRPTDLPPIHVRGAFAELFRAGSGSYVTGALLAVLAALDRFALGRYQGVSAVGIYTAALAAASVVRFVPSAVGQVLFVTESSADGTDPGHRRRARWVVLTAQGLAAVTAPFIIVWFYGPAFRAAVPIAFVLVVSEVFLGIALLEYRILAAKERTRSLVLISVSMLVTAVILYTVGARAGVLPLAIAVTIQSAVFAGALVIARRRFERAPEPA